MPQKYKILITGSSGMLGTDLSRQLSEDYEVAGLDIVESPNFRVYKFYECDIADKDAVLRAITEVRPDIVVHTAAWTDVDDCERAPDKCFKLNSYGTRNVVLACKETGAVLIYISTDFVFDGKIDRPYREDDKANPISVYGNSKFKGEEAIRESLKKYFILRTSWLYGSYGKNFVDTILKKAELESVLKVVDDQKGSPTYTKDLIGAISALIKKYISEKPEDKYGIYHICGTGYVSWCDYAKEMIALAGLSAKVVPITAEELGRAAKRPEISMLDNSKFLKFTGYKMRNWKDALREYVANRKIA